MKREVRIVLLSRVEEPDGEVRETVQVHEGLWYGDLDRGTLRWTDDGVSSTLRWAPDEWRLVRHGERLEATQVFRPGLPQPFDFRSAAGILPFETACHRLEARPRDGGLELDLEYSLWGGGQRVGDFCLRMTATLVSAPGTATMDV
ncbi:MAG: DUF1934 family protein [Candidatus Sericytochromatia bacterium]|nr:DUF1934 family protein [Candidatus Sericytochromatia bacterium]